MDTLILNSPSHHNQKMIVGDILSLKVGIDLELVVTEELIEIIKENNKKSPILRFHAFLGEVRVGIANTPTVRLEYSKEKSK